MPWTASECELVQPVQHPHLRSRLAAKREKRRRRLDAPLGLVVLGSDKIADTTDTPNMQVRQTACSAKRLLAVLRLSPEHAGRPV